MEATKEVVIETEKGKKRNYQLFLGLAFQRIALRPPVQTHRGKIGVATLDRAALVAAIESDHGRVLQELRPRAKLQWSNWELSGRSQS